MKLPFLALPNRLVLVTALIFSLDPLANAATAKSTLDPNAAEISVNSFKAKVNLSNFNVERISLAIDCSPNDVWDFKYIHYLELKVNKSLDGVEAENPSIDRFHVKPNSGLCSVSVAAFTTIDGMQNRADINIYGTVLPATKLSKLDVAADVSKRLSQSTIVGKTLSNYPYFESNVIHSFSTTNAFCVQPIGRSYQNPNVASIYKQIKFGEMATTTKQIVGEMKGAVRSNAMIYFSCNGTDRTLQIQMPDSNQSFENSSKNSTPPTPQKYYRATFSSDFSLMFLNGSAWSLVP